MTRPQSSLPSASQVSQALAGRVSELVQELLPGGRRSAGEWICGSVAGEKGSSLAVHLYGAKAGVWADFATGEAGDALDLVAACQFSGNKSEALKWAASWLGFSNGSVPPPLRATSVPKDDSIQQAERAKRSAQAARLWLAGSLLQEGDPVWSYLAGRKIDLAALPRLPRVLKFEANCWCSEVGRNLPAMLASITGPDGKIAAVHRTWLAQDKAGVWRKAPLKSAKKILGPFGGGSIRLCRGETGKPLAQVMPEEHIYIGEGIETCLSAALLLPGARVLAACSLGNIGRVTLPKQAFNVTIIADNDTNADAQRGLERAVESLLSAGKRVRVAKSPVGKDFNDALCAL